MARTHNKLPQRTTAGARLFAALALLLLGSAGAAPADTPQDKKVDPRLQGINMDAKSLDVDYKTHVAVYKDIVITQEDLKVQADRAYTNGTTFDNAQWTFEGNVRIQSEQRGNLHSDHAVVDFKNNHLAKATVDGSPAEFEQKRADSDEIAHGHAGQIVYDVSDGTVRLSQDAWLSDGRNEISGPLLVYNIREQKVQAASPAGTDTRVHITITPNANGKIETGKKP